MKGTFFVADIVGDDKKFPGINFVLNGFIFLVNGVYNILLYYRLLLTLLTADFISVITNVEHKRIKKKV